MKPLPTLVYLLSAVAGVVATEGDRREVESLRGRMGEGERQVEGLFESLLAEAFS